MQVICHKLEKRRADFFLDNPNAIRFNVVHLCPSMLLSLSFCCISFELLSSFKWLLQCFDLRFGHFGCYEINTSFGSQRYVQIAKTRTGKKPSNPSRTYHQLSTLKRNIHQPFGRIFKTFLFPGLFSASGPSRKNLTSINNVKFSYSLYVLPQPIIDIFSPATSPTGALFL